MSASVPAVPSRIATKITLAEALGSARDTRALILGCGVVTETGRVFREQFPASRAVIVADEQTFALAARTVGEAFVAAGVECVTPFIYSGNAPYAEFSAVAALETSLREHDAIPVAVGAGTINDLTKLAAHRAGRQGYLCVATAASMDGYTAFGASITYRGSKQTFNCPAPRAVVADIDIIRGAPSEMTAAGYADLQSKITAGADWILADALGVDPIEPRAWEIVQGGLSDSLADPAGARAGRVAAIGPLVEGLMLGGFAMQWARSSRPASGAEHQFSHLWDMEHHTHHGDAPSHGFKVGIATLAVTALYEAVLRRTLDQPDLSRFIAQWPDAPEAERGVRRLFAASDFVETAVQETRAKHGSRIELEAQLERARTGWQETRGRLLGQLVPFAELKRRLLLVGAPTEPEEIGISREHLRNSFRRAYHIRRRFTVLDFAVRAGLLDECLETMFGAGGALHA